MKMKSKLLYVHMVMAVMTALVVTATTTKKPTTTTTTWPTTGAPGLNLNGKMFTVSQNGGGISFYPPNFYPTSSPWLTSTTYSKRRYTTTRPYTTRPYYTTTRSTTRPTTIRPTTRPYTTRPYTTRPTTRPYTTRPYTTRPYTTRPTTRPYTTRPYTTTAPPTRGVSVCLRYLTDSTPQLFTLSPSRNPLALAVSGYGYTLTFDRYYNLYMKPNLRFWSNIGPDLWTRVCVTVDSLKNVAQVFSGSNISIRKMLPSRYAWSGEPVINFSGFDGQVTDVQIWDYPLRYREVFNYMTSGVYGLYRGSVLTWSYISYSHRGNTLLEDIYEWQAKQPISSIRERKGRRPNTGKRTRGSYNVGESRREQL